jgi:hypothetical protein
MGDSGPAHKSRSPPTRTDQLCGEKLAQLYVDNIVKLHSVPSRIVLD